MNVPIQDPFKVVLAALGVLSGMPFSLHATDITWTNSSGGDWSVSANWSPHQVPGPADRAILPLFVVVTVNADTTVSNLDLSNSTLGGSATLTVNGKMNWTAGTMNGGGTTVVAPGATLVISGASAKSIGPRTIENYRTVALTGGNVTGLSYGSTWDNATNALVDFQGDASLLAPYGGTNVLNNAGTVRKSGGTGISQLGLRLDNLGTVIAQSGTLSLSGSGDSQGFFDALPGATPTPPNQPCWWQRCRRRTMIIPSCATTRTARSTARRELVA